MALKMKVPRNKREHVVESLEGIEDEELNPSPSTVIIGSEEFEVRPVPAKAWFPISAVATSVINVIFTIVEEREKQKQDLATELREQGKPVEAEELLKAEAKWGWEDLLPYASLIAEALGPVSIKMISYWLKAQIMEKVFPQSEPSSPSLRFLKPTSEQTDQQVVEWVEENLQLDQLIDCASEIIRVGNVDRVSKNWGAMAARMMKKYPNLLKNAQADAGPVRFVLPSPAQFVKPGPELQEETPSE